MFNLEELKRRNREKKKIKEKTYKNILQLIYNKVKIINKTDVTECYYSIPNIIGQNLISDIDECMHYIEKKLRKHPFDEVKIYKPNMIYVRW